MTSVRRLLPLLLLLASVSSLPAWRWPVPVPVVRSEFGELRRGSVSRGIEIGEGAQPVFPVSGGVVVATSDPEGVLDNGLGQFVIVEHPEAFRTVYAHLESGPLPAVGLVVDEGTRIGRTGATGQTIGAALSLMVIDLENGDYVNPRLLLPDLPDNMRPFISNIELTGAGGTFTPTEELPQGRYTVSARVADLASVNSAESGPYSLGLFSSGQSILAVVFDRIAVRLDGMRIGIDELDPSGLLVPERRFMLGEIELRGAPVDIEIVAADFAGNQRVWSAELRGISEDVQ